MRTTILAGLLAAASVAAFAAPATGQSPSTFNIAGDVEYARPKVEVRALTKEERSGLKALLKEFDSGSGYASLRLETLAKAGEREAMKRVMLGYSRTDRGYEHLRLRNTALAAMWAAEYWKLHGPDRDAAQFIDACMGTAKGGGVFGAKNAVYDCGFDVTMAGGTAGDFGRYARKEGNAPKNVTFAARSLTPGDEVDAQRFAKTVSLLKGGGDITPLERTWAKEYADRTGPEQIATLQAAIDDFPNAVARLRAVNREIAARYREDDIKEWTALDAKANLTPMDLERFERLSITLGRDYLAKFGRKYVIYGKTHIDKTCIIDADVCRMQTALYEERKMQAEAEARARNAPIKDWGAQLFVDVRTYDQSGNYIGTQTMTRSQADTVGAR